MADSVIPLTPDLWVFQSSRYGMNSGVWIRDGEACLIDPGILPEEIAQIGDFLEEQEADPRMVVLTHYHWDHLLGARAFSGAGIVAHTNYTAGQDEASILEDLEKEGLVFSDHPFVFPRPSRLVRDELVLPLGDTTLRLMHAPGHSPDHLVIYHPESATLWAGDLLSDREIPYVMDSFSDYEQTLATLANLPIWALVPGHGEPATDPQEIQRRFTTDMEYLAMLRMAITEALKQGLSMETTVLRCAEYGRMYPSEYREVHRLNVESAYVQLRGVETSDAVGWDRTKPAAAGAP